MMLTQDRYRGGGRSRHVIQSRTGRWVSLDERFPGL